jgi:uncharacterized protein YbcV (DUF1398 family)
MKIYILTDTEEIVTEDAVLAAMLTEIYSVNSSEDKNHLVQAYDAKIAEMFGANARHLGSEQ